MAEKCALIPDEGDKIIDQTTGLFIILLRRTLKSPLISIAFRNNFTFRFLP